MSEQKAAVLKLYDAKEKRMKHYQCFKNTTLVVQSSKR